MHTDERVNETLEAATRDRACRKAHLHAPFQDSHIADFIGTATAGLQLGWQELGDTEVVSMVRVETCLGRAS